ncbi:MAG: cytochrome c oxidase assembly protein [Chloroflexi bacterium]|nr:MAG: cytochrome c oxidase assembly protein [Chloroflexota bacterium]
MGWDNIGGLEWLDWHLHPDVLLLCFGLIAGYLYAVEVLRPQISDAGRVKRRQMACFFSGVLVIYIGAGSPVHDISEQYLLSVHMFQHLLFTLVAPPLLLAGIPGWLWQAGLRGSGLMPVARVLVHPLVAFGVFNFLIVVTHLPNVVDYSLEHHWFHFLVHAGLVVSAMMMWWPVLSNVPELPRLSYPLQMAYLFVQSLLPAVIAAFITFSTSPVYSFYANAPRIWGLSAVEDQQIGAGLMKVAGSLILWSFIGVAFFKWFEREEAEARGPAWREVEEELQELGLEAKK